MPFDPIATQEEFDERVKARLRRERERVMSEYSDYEDIKAAAADSAKKLDEQGRRIKELEEAACPPHRAAARAQRRRDGYTENPRAAHQKRGAGAAREGLQGIRRAGRAHSGRCRGEHVRVRGVGRRLDEATACAEIRAFVFFSVAGRHRSLRSIGLINYSA